MFGINDTANIIEESVKNADSRVRINEEVLTNPGEINARVAKVNQLVADIAAASAQ